MHHREDGARLQHSQNRDNHFGPIVEIDRNAIPGADTGLSETVRQGVGFTVQLCEREASFLGHQRDRVGRTGCRVFGVGLQKQGAS
jgi:hypothetical protein